MKIRYSMKMITDKAFISSLQESGRVSENDQYLLNQYMDRWKVSAYDAVTDSNMMTDMEFADVWARMHGFERFFEEGIFESYEPRFDLLSYIECKKSGLLVIQEKFHDKALYILCKNPTICSTQSIEKKISTIGAKIAIIEGSSLDRVIDRASILSTDF